MAFAYERKDGKPSAYQFLIGHCERFENNGSTVEMYMEHGVYHVRMHTPEKSQVVWDVFDNSENDKLGRARKRFNELKKTIR